MNCITSKIFEPKTKLYKLEELDEIPIENIERFDMDILSSRNKMIKASFWQKKNNPSKNMVLVLCGNMGNRLSALYL